MPRSIVIIRLRRITGREMHRKSKPFSRDSSILLVTFGLLSVTFGLLSVTFGLLSVTFGSLLVNFGSLLVNFGLDLIESGFISVEAGPRWRGDGIAHDVWEEFIGKAKPFRSAMRPGRGNKTLFCGPV